MKKLLQRGLWVSLIVTLSVTMSGLVSAQPVVVNEVSSLRSVNGDNPENHANPSDPGVFAGDINGDGLYDYLQHSLTFKDIRDPESEDGHQTIFLTYDEFGRTIKSALYPGRYFPVGDTDNNGTSELVKQNEEGNVDILSFSEDPNNPFSINAEVRVIETPPGITPRVDWVGTGDIDSDALADILMCENEYDSYNTCVLVNGIVVSNNATTIQSKAFDLPDYVDFSSPPQLLVDNSIAGGGDSFYAIGTADNYTKEVMVEFGVDENGDVISLLEYDWVSTSGESAGDRRFYFEDVDGDGEIEIISSDDRVFPLSGFRRIYFNTPVCDYREVDYTGTDPVIQSPDVISNSCVVDRVYRDDDDIARIGVWEEGNYKACDAELIPVGCSQEPFINDDQTILPLPVEASKVQNQPNDIFLNGVADPSRQARGLQAMTPDELNNLIFQPLFLVPEILRIAEIYKAKLLRAVAGQATEIFLRTLFFAGNVQNEQTCTLNTPTCELSNSSSYYSAVQQGAGGPINNGARVIGGRYRHYTAGRATDDQENSLPFVYVTVDDRKTYVPHSNDLEFDEMDKINPAATLIEEYDTLEVSAQVNTEPLGNFDQTFITFTVKNLGDIDGVPGDELLIGSNSMASGGQAVNKAWIYLGENTTYQEPDYVIDFNNDSTITTSSFIGLGDVAEGLGDINGDGIGDFAVGVPGYDQRFDGESYGAVYVFTGIDRSAAKVATDTSTFETPFLILRPEDADYSIGRFGSEISGGDFDGDGFNDIAVLADYGSGEPVSPTIRVYKGGAEMDESPDYFLNVTEEQVGGFSSDTVNYFFGAVVHFMPEEAGADHQDLYFTPGPYSGYPDAVIFTGGIDEQTKKKGMLSPKTTPSVRLAEAGPTTTGSGVYTRCNPATGDLNGDGKYEVIVVKQYDGRDGAVSSRLLIFSPNAGTGVFNEEEGVLNPLEFRLSQNYPNPFNPSTNIEFRLGAASPVTIRIYDILGREVATVLDDQNFNSGSHTVRFDASALASGIYLYKLEAGAFSQTRKMTLIK